MAAPAALIALSMLALVPPCARRTPPPRAVVAETVTPQQAHAAPSAAATTFFAQGQGGEGQVGSAALLQRIRERQEATGELTPEAHAARLAKRICEFLARRGGKASSAQLVGEFQSADVDARLLKGLLKECAEKDASGAWVLKQGFRP